MAYSYEEYTQTQVVNAAGILSVPFPYIQQAHVSVVRRTAVNEPWTVVSFTWINPSSIQVTGYTGLPSTWTYRIRRSTPGLIATLSSPSVFRSSVLNTIFRTLLYFSQEGFDAGEESLLAVSGVVVAAQASAALAEASAITAQTQAVNASSSASAASSSAAAAAASASSIDTTAINNAINIKYDKAGGVLTGDVTVQKDTPVVGLNKSASGQFNLLRGSTNGVLRWDVILGDDSIEGGGDTGSQFAISRYSNAGSFLGYGLTIRRSDGYTVVPANIEFGTAGGGHAPLLRRFGTTIGGTLQFEVPSTGSTLSGPVRMRVNANSVEISEAGGTSRGVNIDLTTAASAAGSALIHSGNLGAQIAAISHTAVGAYGLFSNSTALATGANTAGSNLIYAVAGGAGSGNPSGTWRNHSGQPTGTQVILCQRVA